MSTETTRSSANRVMIGAVLFVVAVRLLLDAISLGLALPLAALKKRLPSTGDSPDWIGRLRCWLAAHTEKRLPEWAEHRGNSMLMLRTTRASGCLDDMVRRIPDRLVDAWRRFGVATMVVFLVGWAIVLLAGLGAAVWGLWTAAPIAVEWALAYDWVSLLEPGATPSVDPVARLVAFVTAIPEMLATAGRIAVMLAAAVVVSWLVYLVLVPGLALHEFGHYATIRKTGGEVDNYGLVLFGPLPGGAFVEPERETEDLPASNQFWIWSAGIANSVLWGCALLAVGVVVAGDPVAVVSALATHEYGVFASAPAGAVLLGLGLIEVGNGFFNAIPAGIVDGGGFIRAAEAEWWGFEESDPLGERVAAFADKEEAEP